MRHTFALLLFACFAFSARADPLDDWCETATLPSSVAICSDADLRALARERQRSFDEAGSRLSPEEQKALLADQTAWVHSYARACGLSDAPPSLPLAPEIKNCMYRAGLARIAYLQAYGAPSTTGGNQPGREARPPQSPSKSAEAGAPSAPLASSAAHAASEFCVDLLTKGDPATWARFLGVIRTGVAAKDAAAAEVRAHLDQIRSTWLSEASAGPMARLRWPPEIWSECARSEILAYQGILDMSNMATMARGIDEMKRDEALSLDAHRRAVSVLFDKTGAKRD